MNEYTKKFIEQEYQIIEFLSEDKKTALVKDSLTGGIYVKKEISSDAVCIYQRLAGLNIKGLPAVIKTGEDFVLTEYVSGIPLNKKIERDGVMNVHEAKKHMVTLCDCVKTLHTLGIIHRDITASNIIIGQQGCYLIDLGIAREKKINKGADTQILGTVGYAAPEQFGFTQSDERTDIYALGVVYNYMLTGALPNQRLCLGPESSVIKKCIEIDGKNRYKSVNRLKKALCNEHKIGKYVCAASGGALFACIVIASAALIYNTGKTADAGSASFTPAPVSENSAAPSYTASDFQSSFDGKLTREIYDKISMGMRYEDVVNLIGEAPDSEYTTELFGTTELTCTWWGQGDIGANAVIDFRDGVVTGKTQTDLK